MRSQVVIVTVDLTRQGFVLYGDERPHLLYRPMVTTESLHWLPKQIRAIIHNTQREAQKAYSMRNTINSPLWQNF